MTNFNIALSPLLPWPLLLVLALGAIAVTALGVWSGRRGAWIRALGLALILFALADPSLVREDRQPLKDVVAVVVDRSASQSIANRTAQTDAARAQVRQALEGMDNVEIRMVEAGASAGQDDGTQLFSGARSPRSPTCRPSASAAPSSSPTASCTTFPLSADQLGFRAPRACASSPGARANATGASNSSRRRASASSASDQTIVVRVHDTGDRGEPIELVIRRDGQEVGRTRASAGALARAVGAHRARRPQRRRARSGRPCPTN